MKKKELKNIAMRIAKAEQVLSESADVAAKRQAEEEILALTRKVTNLADICLLDEMIQDILSKS